MNRTILIYGATGYTGKLIAKTAADQDTPVVLAGRDLRKVKSVAEPLGLNARAFDLRDPARIDAALKGVSVVLNLAGPFSATSRPVADACLRNRVHYLDITGEIEVFLRARTRGHIEDALARGWRLIVGGGPPSGSAYERGFLQPNCDRRPRRRRSRNDPGKLWADRGPAPRAG